MGLALLCPGQGGQHRAMFDLLVDQQVAQAELAQAAAILGYDPRARVRDAPADALFVNATAQPLVCAAIRATWTALAPSLPPPLLVAGYSVGELAAYGCAGALDMRQLLALAAQRARVMDAATTVPAGMMAVIGLDRDQVQALCRAHSAHIAIVNGPDHFIIGAPAACLEALETDAGRRGAARIARLRVGIAAHTPLLRAASGNFAATLAASPLGDPRLPVLAGISGAAVRTRSAAIAALSAQLSTTVDWQACMRSAWEMGARVYLEIGPGNALARMLRDAYPDAAVRSVDDFRSLDGVRRWVRAQLP